MADDQEKTEDVYYFKHHRNRVTMLTLTLGFTLRKTHGINASISSSLIHTLAKRHITALPSLLKGETYG